MASNIMLVDDHILWMSQKEEKACTSIVRSLERIAAHTLSSNSQHMAVVRGSTGWGWTRGGRVGGLLLWGLRLCQEGLCLCQG